MKKLIALILVLALASALALSALAENAPAGDPPPPKTTGTLSLLNYTEEGYAAFVAFRKQIGNLMIKEGYAEQSANHETTPPEGAPMDEPPEGAPMDEPPEGAPMGTPPEGAKDKIIFYDTLDALLMALNTGDITGIEIYQSVARYLCATNDNLELLVRYDRNKEQNRFAEMMMTGINANDFAFLMLEENAELRDAFNAAIADMKADGTLGKLVKEQIDDLVNGGEITPVELPKIDGAKTVKVAVTGALPPMDYVAPDGTPAGFNTAVLAEISRRIGMNIELVQVDSVGRAFALAGGVVDAVFWTRTSSKSQMWTGMTEEERQADKAGNNAGMTEEEISLMNELRERFDFKAYGTTDMPDGTIVTEPYFSDVLVMVALPREAPQGK